MQGIKDTAVMILSNAIYTEALTEDQTLNVLLAMDRSAEGNIDDIEERAKALTPIVASLMVRYKEEGMG